MDRAVSWGMDQGMDRGVWIVCGSGALIHTLYFDSYPYIYVCVCVCARVRVCACGNFSGIKTTSMSSLMTPIKHARVECGWF